MPRTLALLQILDNENMVVWFGCTGGFDLIVFIHILLVTGVQACQKFDLSGRLESMYGERSADLSVGGECQKWAG